MYKVFDRLLIVLLMLTVVICGVALIALAWSPYVLEGIVFWLYATPVNPAIVSAVCLLLIVAALRVLLFGGRARKEVPGVLVIAGELGRVEITLDTMAQLVESFMAGVAGMSHVRQRLEPREEGLAVALRVAVEPGTVIPEVSASVQAGLKKFLESTTGIAVAEVSVTVDNPPAKAKDIKPAAAARNISTVATVKPAAPAEESGEPAPGV